MICSEILVLIKGVRIKGAKKKKKKVIGCG